MKNLNFNKIKSCETMNSFLADDNSNNNIPNTFSFLYMRHNSFFVCDSIFNCFIKKKFLLQ